MAKDLEPGGKHPPPQSARVKIKKCTEDLNTYLSRVYLSPDHLASFNGLDKLYRIVKKEFPSITRNEIKQWAETNLSYSLHKPSWRNFKRIKTHAPEIDSLWEADLTFVQDVAKENDGVNYLLVVIVVFCKFLLVRPMKKKSARSLVQAFHSILSEKRKPEKLRTDKGTEFVSFSSISRSKESNFTPQRTNIRPRY